MPADITPADMEVDGHGRFYLSDPTANKVYQLDAAGKVLRTFGRLDAQKPGALRPADVHRARQAGDVDRRARQRPPDRGRERRAEPRQRVERRRQAAARVPVAADQGQRRLRRRPGAPRARLRPRPRRAGSRDSGWTTPRGTWTIDAVWPDVGTDPRAPGLKKPIFVRANGLRLPGGGERGDGRTPSTSTASDGDRWMLLRRDPPPRRRRRSTNSRRYLPLARRQRQRAGGRRRADPRPTRPAASSSYHGQNWAEDLSFLAIAMGGQDVWRLAPTGFDAHGNPVFKDWQKAPRPTRSSRPAPPARPTRSTAATSWPTKFTSDWMQADGTAADGLLRPGARRQELQRQRGRAAQNLPLRPRRPRAATRSSGAPAGPRCSGLAAEPAKCTAAMRIRRPINGLLSVVDQSRCGVLLYTDDGLYVDTLFPDGRRFAPQEVGLYAQPGEFFAGTVYPEQGRRQDLSRPWANTRRCCSTVDGWSLKENPVQPLTSVQKTVTLAAAADRAAAGDRAEPARRGGRCETSPASPRRSATWPSTARWPAGSRAEPVTFFEADKDQTVEVRCLYRPDQLLLRWHARLAGKFEAKPLPPPERIFTHDQLADTLSFYVQGDVNAEPGGPRRGPAGRRALRLRPLPGRRRQDRSPSAVGMYPQWHGPGNARPQIYRTPVGQAAFAHVGASRRGATRPRDRRRRQGLRPRRRSPALRHPAR